MREEVSTTDIPRTVLGSGVQVLSEVVFFAEIILL